MTNKWRVLDQNFRATPVASPSPAEPCRAHLSIPACSLHEQPMDIGTLTRSTGKILSALLRHVALQRHLVQGPLVFPGRGLHDGRQEGLGVEEPSEPQRGGQGEVPGPGFQLADASQQVSKPRAQAGSGGVRPPHPGLGHRAQEEAALQGLHVAGHGQFPLVREGTVSTEHCPAQSWARARGRAQSPPQTPLATDCG